MPGQSSFLTVTPSLEPLRRVENELHPLMNFSYISIRTALLALTGLAASALSARADLVVAPVKGDVFLAFRATAGQGAGSSYIVKIGQDTLFSSTAPTASFVVGIAGAGGPGTGNIGADLEDVYGSDWSTRPNLYWSVFGSYKSPDPTVYGSRLRPKLATLSTAWPALAFDGRTNVANQINSVLTTTRGYSDLQATANSTVAVVQPNAGELSSYNYQVATAGTSDFGSLSQWTSIEGNAPTGIKNTVLDFYRVASASAPVPGVTRLGNFTISPSGVLTFSGNSLPPASLDSDGDGYTDEYEVYSGTDRDDATSFFRVESFAQTPSGPQIQFSTTPTRKYEIQYSANLTNPWQVIKSISAGAAAAPVDFIDTDPVRSANTKGFYRARIVP